MTGCGVSTDPSTSNRDDSTISSEVDPNALKYVLSSAGSSYAVRANNKDTISGEIVIPDLYDNKPITAIDTTGFGDTKITSITMPKYLMEISGGSFLACSDLVSVTLNDEVVTIDSSAFNQCKSLKDIVFTEKITSIGNYGFFGCESLVNVVLPNKLAELGSSAFSSCTSLKFVDLGDSLSMIQSSCFSSCEKLEAIKIPDKVTTISVFAFRSCAALSKVYYSGTIEKWNAIQIESFNDALLEATKYFYSENEPVEEGHYWHYVNDEIREW